MCFTVASQSAAGRRNPGAGRIVSKEYFMLKRIFPLLSLVLPVLFLAGCGGTPYTPPAGEAAPVDMDMHLPRVDAFVVLLDTSGSMQGEEPDAVKFQTALNLVANFNSAVPDVPYSAGLVVFGGGTDMCMGNGVASTLYGMTTYDKWDFQDALGSIDCVRSITPIVDAVDMSTDLLADETGEIAVVVFSDFQWRDASGVRDAVAALRDTHGERVCVHAVKIGDQAVNVDLMGEITGSCGSSVSAATLEAPAAMTDYVATVLTSPVAMESYTLSATTLFRFDSDELTPAGEEELARLGAGLRGKGIRVGDIDIIGHTCDKGSEAYNQGLSERRADAIRAYLVDAGIDPDSITAAGMGELDPLVPNSSENNRRLNRRVEVHVATARPQGS
jgi:OOP family OmpA-OmpF porin